MRWFFLAVALFSILSCGVVAPLSSTSDPNTFRVSENPQRGRLACLELKGAFGESLGCVGHTVLVGETPQEVANSLCGSLWEGFGIKTQIKDDPRGGVLIVLEDGVRARARQTHPDWSGKHVPILIR
ncbi:MAG: hypothetical protein QGH51_02490 [Planctomycetota bacterium]|jgi:hypothetical protein|nr:hypothetical protein [Planctomycetota bacterium]